MQRPASSTGPVLPRYGERETVLLLKLNTAM
jgi:hypothetical protein